MAAANTLDFLGEGTANSGTARPLTLEEQARAEEARLRQREQERRLRSGETSVRNSGYRDTRAASDNAALDLSNRTVTEDRIRRTGSARGNQKDIWGNLADDPVTTGVLLAPLGVAGAGLAVGGPAALGFGEAAGLGSIATPAGASPYVGGANGVQAVGQPFMMASPHVAGTPTGLGGAGAAGSSAAAPAASAAKDAWTWKDTVRTAAPLATAGLSSLFESFIRGGGDDERRKLREKQEQIARETELRRQQQQQARMDAIGARVSAFNPHNQLLASMFGPQAAFQPEQLAGLAANPMKPQLDPELQNYRGTDDKKEQQIRDYMAAMEKYNAAEAARKERVMGSIQRPGPGPAPLQQRTPLAAKRF